MIYLLTLLGLLWSLYIFFILYTLFSYYTLSNLYSFPVFFFTSRLADRENFMSLSQKVFLELLKDCLACWFWFIIIMLLRFCFLWVCLTFLLFYFSRFKCYFRHTCIYFYLIFLFNSDLSGLVLRSLILSLGAWSIPPGHDTVSWALMTQETSRNLLMVSYNVYDVLRSFNEFVPNLLKAT